MNVGALKAIMNDASVKTLQDNESKMNLYSMPEDCTLRWMDAVNSGRRVENNLSPSAT